MRVAILTFHKAYNCGAMLQAWALRTILEEGGHQVVFPDCNSVGLSPRWQLSGAKNETGLRKLAIFGLLLLRNILSIGYLDYNRYCYRRFRNRELRGPRININTIKDICDIIIIGSDQVWHPGIAGKDTPLFLAETIPHGIPIIAYAASFGDKKLDGDSFDRIIGNASRFKAISVREDLAQSELQQRKIDAKLVLDPTLLLIGDDYAPLVGERPIKEKYLFLYAVSLSGYVLKTARELAHRLALKLVVCGVYVRSRYGAPSECLWGVSPEKMVTLIAHAEFVMAASFHGTAFSLIFSKPFLSLRDSVDNSPTRISTILKEVGLSVRIVNPARSMDEVEGIARQPIDWADVHDKLLRSRSDSFSFLRENLQL